MKIDKDVLEIIDAGITEGNVYYLPKMQLDRSMYTKVNKVLEILGGKWNRKQKGHIFETSIDDRIDDIILTGEIIDKKKELQFFETPENIALQICELANIKPDSTVLEPSAGRGAILKAAGRYSPQLYWAELDEENASHIRIGIRIGKNFLEIEPDEIKFDRIIMNPPFSRQQDIDHVTHALKFLKDDGILISVMSASIKFRTNKKTKDFLECINEYETEIIDLPAKSFASSGTMVNTIILKVDKGL